MIMTQDEIIREVAREFGLKVSDLLGKSRKRMHAWPRFVAWSIIRNNLGYSYPVIGKRFGRDHTTVIVGVRAAEIVAEQEFYKSRVASLRSRIASETWVGRVPFKHREYAT